MSDKIRELVETDPKSAVIEMWRELEATITQLIQHNGMIRFTRPDHFMHVLLDEDRITVAEYDGYKHLARFKNECLRRDARMPTTAEVLELKRFSERLVARLEEIRAEPGYINVSPEQDARENLR